MKIVILVLIFLLLITLCVLSSYLLIKLSNLDSHTSARKGIDEDEQVNHPAHYKDSNGKECIDYMRDKFGDEAVYWFCKCNSFKYNFRAGKKKNNSEKQDKDKAEWYNNYAKMLKQHINI